MASSAKRKLLIALITLGVCAVVIGGLFAWLVVVGPPAPPGWRDLAPGDTPAVALQKVPGLEADISEPCLFTCEKTHFLGMEFEWFIAATFDSNWKLQHVRASSENIFCDAFNGTIDW